MTSHRNILIREALDKLKGKRLPGNVVEAFTIAAVLDMAEPAHALTPPELCESLRAGLKAFLFKKMGAPEAFLLAESSWVAADLAEALATETEELFVHQYEAGA